MNPSFLKFIVSLFNFGFVKRFLKLVKISTMQTIDYEDFEKSDLRVGTIIKAENFEKARKPAFKIWVDLGEEVGIKKSSAQITDYYQIEDLIGLQVVCVCNLKPRQIADFISEVLVTGFSSDSGGIILTSVERPVPNGAKLH
jgi:tRNA-binding protein